MNTNNPVRVFIGSGEASAVERQILIHSLRKHCSRELDLYVFNGTHNAIEHNGEAPVLADMPLHIKYRNFTEFSLYRYLIPSICEHQGRAIFLDSDIISLADIAPLFDHDMEDNDILAVSEYEDGSWASSVMLINCETTRFDLPGLIEQIDRGDFELSDLTRFTPAFLKHHPLKIGQLSNRWNSFDAAGDDTALLHYTNLLTQPWKAASHPLGQLWFDLFEEARSQDSAFEPIIDKAIWRSYVRPTIREGNTPQMSQKTKKTLWTRIQREVGGLLGKKKAA